MAVTDLTGYTWTGNVPPKNSSSTYYNINYVACEYHWTTFSPGYYNQGERMPPIPESIWFGNDNVESGGEPHYIYNYNTSSWGLFDYGDFSFTEVQNGNVIQITGGTDATNATLIAWLEANGTLTPPVVTTGKTQIGNRAITKKMFGTREITKEVVNGVTIYEKQASGYSITGWNYAGGNMGAAGVIHIKFNSTPTSDDDYDIKITDRGYGMSPEVHLKYLGTTVYGVNNIPLIENVGAFYYWGTNIQGLEINNVIIIPVGSDINIVYTSASEYTLSGNITSLLVRLMIYD